MDAAAKKMLVPGAFVEIRTPQGKFNAVVGTTELGMQTPPDPNTHFRITSNSKTMTAAVIVLLAQDGTLKFSDPVSDYVPEVPNGTDITIADLLKMRSGLYNYTNAPEFSATGCRSGESVDAAGGVGHRLRASAERRTRHHIRVQQHQLRPCSA